MSPATIAPRHLLLLLLLALIWSSSFLLIKIGVQSLPPLTLSAGRMLLAAVLLSTWAAARGHRLPRGARLWFAFAFVGVFGNALPFTLIHWGELTLDSGLAAILMGVMPVVTVALAHLAAADEPLTAARLGGVLVGFAGLVVLVGADALAGLGAHVLAESAVLGGALCYAITTVFVRRWVRAPGALMAAGSLSVGSACMLPLALLLEQPLALSPSGASLAAMAALGVFSTGIAALIYFHLVSQVGATFFSQVNYLVPLLGVGWGWLILAESPAATALLGLGLILTGVALVNRRTRAG